MAISVFKPGGGASDFEFPATDGTAGQALVTNGAGALSFASMEQGFDFIQTTAPTITADGQVWLKPTDGVHPGTAGVWLSRVITTSPFVAYWVRQQPHIISLGCEAITATTTFGTAHFRLPGGYVPNAPYTFCDGIKGNALVAAPADGSNYWSLNLIAYKYPFTASGTNGGALGSFFDIDSSTTELWLTTASVNIEFQKVINNRYPYTASQVNSVALIATKAGSPGTLTRAALSIYLREIHP